MGKMLIFVIVIKVKEDREDNSSNLNNMCVIWYF